MEYATSYDVGDRKRGAGLNEDSVAIAVFEEGHRDGRLDAARGPEPSTARAEATEEAAGPPEGATDRADHPGTADAAGAAGGPDRSAAAFALADGAGGHDAGDVASYIATTVIPEELAPTAVRAARSDPGAFGVDLESPRPHRPRPAELRSAVAAAVVTANREILRYADDTGAGAFTTAVAGLCLDGRLHYGWVGDSRLYVLNGAAGTIERLTADHSAVADLEAAGEIDAVEAHVHPRGNEITRALGGHPGADPETATVEVDTASVELYAEDVVLATSDGLVDAQTDAPALFDRYVESGRSDAVAEAILEAVVTDADIREWVASAPDLDAAARNLVARANERGGKDNISTLLFRDRTLAPTPDSGPARSLADEGPITDRETLVRSEE